MNFCSCPYGIHQAKNCLDKKENIAQNSENCVIKGKGNQEKREKRDKQGEIQGKEETRQNNSEGVRRKRKVKGREEVREL